MIRIWAIARNTFRQALRQKLLLVLPLFALALAATLWLMPAISEKEHVKLVVQMSLGLMTFFGTVVAVFLSAWSTPAEIEGRQIYSVVTKPVHRGELLLGKLLGFLLVVGLLLGVMMMLAFGAVRLAARRAGVPGRLARPLAPVEVRYAGEGGGEWKDGRLELTIAATQPGERWDIVVDGQPPAVAAMLPVALRIDWLRGKKRAPEPSRSQWKNPGVRTQFLELLKSQDVRARLSLAAYAADGAKLWQTEQDVLLQYSYAPPGDKERRGHHFLRAEFELAKQPASLASVSFTLLSTDPGYKPAVRWYDQRASDRLSPRETVLWRFVRVPRPRGGAAKADALFEFTHGRFGTGSRAVDVFFEIINPDTGRSKTVRAALKDRVLGEFSFPAHLVGRSGRVDVRYAGNNDDVYLGLRTYEPPLTLRREPVPIEWGYFKGVLLVLAQLTLIMSVATAVSTWVSGPVSILAALVVWLAGTMAGFIKEYVANVEEAAQAVQHAGHSHAPEVLTGWFGAVLNPLEKLLAVVVPDFSRYAAAPHLTAGMDVPGSIMTGALVQTAIYVGLAVTAGWLLLRLRQFN